MIIKDSVILIQDMVSYIVILDTETKEIILNMIHTMDNSR